MPRQALGTSFAPLSSAVRAGDFVFISGQVPLDASGIPVGGGIERQTRQVFANLAEALALADATLADVVKTTVWLTDRADFAAFNAVYAEFFPSAPPARSTLRCDLVLDVRVEIEAIAYAPMSTSMTGSTAFAAEVCPNRPHVGTHLR